MRWHHEYGKTKRIGAGESEAWFNPRRALTVAGRSGRCGIGVRRWIEPLADLSRVSGGPGVASAFEDLLSSRDRELLDDQRYASAFAETVGEGLRQGTRGAGWDNVSWIGEWDIDLSAVCCSVLLWCGSDDRFQRGVTGLLEVTVDRWPSCLRIRHPPSSGCIMLDLTRHMRHESAHFRNAGGHHGVQSAAAQGCLARPLGRVVLLCGHGWVEPYEPHGVCLVEFGDGFS